MRRWALNMHIDWLKSLSTYREVKVIMDQKEKLIEFTINIDWKFKFLGNLIDNLSKKVKV